jgi:molecular chaperone HscB
MAGGVGGQLSCPSLSYRQGRSVFCSTAPVATSIGARYGSLVVSDVTHFERLGLPRQFALDATEVERNYLARSRELHPDYHQLAPAAEQRASMELSAALNEAYATLRHPFRRAEYLLALEGGPTAAEQKEMAPAFLEEMLELRMEIEDLRESAPFDSPARSAMSTQLTERMGQLQVALAESFAEFETPATTEARRKSLLIAVRQILNVTKYLDGLTRDLRAD